MSTELARWVSEPDGGLSEAEHRHFVGHKIGDGRLVLAAHLPSCSEDVVLETEPLTGRTFVHRRQPVSKSNAFRKSTQAPGHVVMSA